MCVIALFWRELCTCPKIDVSTLTQFESARPYTLGTDVDINGDGVGTDRAVVNGRQTALDEFRGTPFAQVDLRISRNFKLGEHMGLRPLRSSSTF